MTRWFGEYGGAYVAPPLVTVLREVSRVFAECADDSSFHAELGAILETFAGRPTPLRRLERLTRHDHASLLVKREDLLLSGGSYINAALGQCLVARRAGATTVICDTGSGHNGVATAAAAAALGLRCVIFMAGADHDATPVMVARMHELGARVQTVDSRMALLSEAVSAAYQAWMAGAPSCFYVSGAPVGPAPYPAMVRYFQQVVGEELVWQATTRCARQPDALVATLGGGSTAIGLFGPFLARRATQLVIAQLPRTSTGGRKLGDARAGVLHGARTLVLQAEDGSFAPPRDVPAGLRYPGAAPEIASLWRDGRIGVRELELSAAHAIQLELAQREGLAASIESCMGVAAALELAANLPPSHVVVATLAAAQDGQLFAGAVHAA